MLGRRSAQAKWGRGAVVTEDTCRFGSLTSVSDANLLGRNVTLMLLGSGELGKEVAIEAARLGVSVVAIDRYSGAPAMQIADRSHVVDMLDPDALLAVIDAEQPDVVVPEVEAIAVGCLMEVERHRLVIPTARGVQLTMNREGIRKLAAEELGIPTSNYRFVDDVSQIEAVGAEVGFPCVVKPIMSSSGKGQSIARNEAELVLAFVHAEEAGRTHQSRVIVESFIDFDYEITLLTVRAVNGTFFCPAIGHRQVDGDYRESWQPQPMSDVAAERARDVARIITDNIGGLGVFGVELFVKGDEVYFSEVSPRPHDTGLVTLVSQDASEFALHVRALLRLPVQQPTVRTPAASATINATQSSDDITFEISEAIAIPGVQARLFGKPTAHVNRRLGVMLAVGEDVKQARARAQEAVEMSTIHYGTPS